MKHLQKERNLAIEKSSAGIYYISKETVEIQIIVVQELPSDENLYLYCLTDWLQDACLINRLADDYNRHAEQQIYADYLQQLTNATALKGESRMVVCEKTIYLLIECNCVQENISGISEDMSRLVAKVLINN